MRTRGLALRRPRTLAIAAALAAFAWLAPATGAAAPALAAPPPASQPDLGPNVLVFDPSMPQSQIQATVDAIGTQQVSNEFGQQRYALLFMPGSYGSKTHPLNFKVGYYTSVAGLGLSPGDVVINGSVYVRNQCFGPGNCVALDNFWRSLSNLTINVTTRTSAATAASSGQSLRRHRCVGCTLTGSPR